jgi:hypothetical protein
MIYLLPAVGRRQQKKPGLATLKQTQGEPLAAAQLRILRNFH